MFCERAERDGLGFLNLTRVKKSVPLLPGETAGVPLFLAFGVSASPGTNATLFLTFVWPNGHSVTNSVLLDVGPSGFLDVAADLGALPVNHVGDIRAEFRFAERGAARYVATLRVVDRPFTVVARSSGEQTPH